MDCSQEQCGNKPAASACASLTPQICDLDDLGHYQARSSAVSLHLVGSRMACEQLDPREDKTFKLVYHFDMALCSG